MRRFLAAFGITIVFCGLVFAQSSEAPQVFDAADVHSSAPTNIPFQGGGLHGSRYELRTATMVDLISIAYGLDSDDKVVGGPSWLATDKFDVIAKAPASTTLETIKLMLQALLADRFKLTVHKDNKPLPAFALTVSKGKAKLKESDGSAHGCQSPQQPNEPGVVQNQVVSCRNFTMAEFADLLPQIASAYIVSPVKDLTGLRGTWDFELRWTAKAELTAAASEAINVFDALDKQLGLKLELQKMAMPVIVVDKVEEKPTDNLPGVVEAIPPAPTEFEVAVIKPSAPDTQRRGGIQPGGRLDVQGLTLQDIITLGWDVKPDMIIGAPKWLAVDSFDIIAKAPAGGPPVPASNGPSTGPPVDLDTLRTMLRALIVDRFKLKVHMEDQSVNVYALTAQKNETKLKRGNPSDRSSCRRPTPAESASNPALTLGYVCQNTTMAQLVAQLRNWAPAYFDHPVIDTTGLEGGWDFSIAWTPKGALLPLPGTATADPNGGLTVFEAVEKQLGLKLVQQKHSMPVLVIDHVEQILQE